MLDNFKHQGERPERVVDKGLNNNEMKTILFFVLFYFYFILI